MTGDAKSLVDKFAEVQESAIKQAGCASEKLFVAEKKREIKQSDKQIELKKRSMRYKQLV